MYQLHGSLFEVLLLDKQSVSTDTITAAMQLPVLHCFCPCLTHKLCHIIMKQNVIVHPSSHFN